jgi:hypothetical protein
MAAGAAGTPHKVAADGSMNRMGQHFKAAGKGTGVCKALLLGAAGDPSDDCSSFGSVAYGGSFCM